MVAIGTELGGKPETFQGLSGLNDLMLACFGRDSKDRQWAFDFVFKKADTNRMSSGLFGLKILPQLIQLDINKFPVASSVYKVIYESVPIEKMFDELSLRLKKF
jgi:glycerol-3-phosphate dehydrogenase